MVCGCVWRFLWAWYETQLLRSSNIPLTKKQIQYEHRWTDHPLTVVDEVLYPARNDKNNEISIMWRHFTTELLC